MRALLVSSLSLLLACGDDGGGGDGGTDPARWQLLASARPSSLLASWASSTTDVWVVGGREAIGEGPVVLRYDGAAWSRLDTGIVNLDLWQVFGFEGGPVFLAGSNGTILRYENGAFEKLTTPGTDIVFGLWGSSPTDVWAVGGQSGGRPFVWRYQGTSFEVVGGLPASLAGAVWKVTGRAADDVWMSCSSGLVLHWDGATLTSEQVGATGESLFSLGCQGDRCVTAGASTSNGVLYESTGAGWTSRVPTTDGPAWRGVTPTGDHRFVVGAFGAVLRDDGGTWVPDPHGLTTQTLHAAWATPTGDLFAVGGQFDRALTLDGVMLYKGTVEMPVIPPDL